MRYQAWIVLFFALIATTNPLLAHSPRAKDKPICSTGFELSTDTDFFSSLKDHELLDVVDGQGVDGGKALKATYVGYDRGSKPIVTLLDLPIHLEEATLVYDVKFDRNFQFTRGGKLHGLGPDKVIAGGRDMKPTGWSARAIFLSKRLGTYVYCQNKDRQYGVYADRRTKFEIPTNRYLSVSIYLKLNNPVDKANGEMRIYVNGQGVAYHSGIQFRSEDGEHTKISKFLFSTFHGGSDPSFAPKDVSGEYTKVYAYFDNFAVYKGLHIRMKAGQP